MAWERVNVVNALLKERGNPRSLQALRDAGLKYGFAKKMEDGHHYLFDIKKVEAYLDCAMQFKTISQFARSLDVSANQLYYRMLKLGIKAKDKYGIKYIAPKDCEILKREFVNE